MSSKNSTNSQNKDKSISKYKKKLAEQLAYINNGGEAEERQALGYMCRALAMSSMPHRRQKEIHFTRSNGAFQLVMVANPHIGLPYGSIPRIMIGWLTTQAVLNSSRKIELGDNLSRFMVDELKIIPSWGKRGTANRVKNQIERLFNTAIMARFDGKKFNMATEAYNFMVAKRYKLWWDIKRPDQGDLWESFMILGHDFYEEIVKRPVPIDWDVVGALRKAPMALDIYFWSTHRFSYLKYPTTIPWDKLQMQFGAGYPMTPQGLRDFRKKFGVGMRLVTKFYPAARFGLIDKGMDGLGLLPTDPSVPKKLK